MQRNLKVVLVALAALASWTVKAQAVDYGDSFTVPFTPVGDRGVMIDTTTIALSSLTLGTTVQTSGDVPVTSTGTIAPIEYTMQASIAGGWSLSTDGVADANNEVALQGLFKATQPSLAEFESPTATTHIINAAGARQVGDATPGNYEVSGGQDLDSLALNAVRNLWLKLKMPPTSDNGALQTITITVTGEPAS